MSVALYDVLVCPHCSVHLFAAYVDINNGLAQLSDPADDEGEKNTEEREMEHSGEQHRSDGRRDRSRGQSDGSRITGIVDHANNLDRKLCEVSDEHQANAGKRRHPCRGVGRDAPRSLSLELLGEARSWIIGGMITEDAPLYIDPKVCMLSPLDRRQQAASFLSSSCPYTSTPGMTKRECTVYFAAPVIAFPRCDPAQARHPSSISPTTVRYYVQICTMSVCYMFHI